MKIDSFPGEGKKKIRGYIFLCKGKGRIGSPREGRKKKRTMSCRLVPLMGKGGKKRGRVHGSYNGILQEGKEKRRRSRKKKKKKGGREGISPPLVKKKKKRRKVAVLF